jgi:hypothetical protein
LSTSGSAAGVKDREPGQAPGEAIGRLGEKCAGNVEGIATACQANKFERTAITIPVALKISTYRHYDPRRAENLEHTAITIPAALKISNIL